MIAETFGPDCASCGQMTRTITGDNGAGQCAACDLVTEINGRPRKYTADGQAATEAMPLLAYIVGFVIPIIGLLTSIYLFAKSEIGPAVAMLLTAILGATVGAVLVLVLA